MIKGGQEQGRVKKYLVDELRHTSLFFLSGRRRHTRFDCDWSSDVCSSDLSPASSAIFAIASAVSGVAEAGLRTTVQPAARAGAILRVTIVAGKFHGVTAATGPIGWRNTQQRLPRRGGGNHSPGLPRASSAH